MHRESTTGVVGRRLEGNRRERRRIARPPGDHWRSSRSPWEVVPDGAGDGTEPDGVNCGSVGVCRRTPSLQSLSRERIPSPLLGVATYSFSNPFECRSDEFNNRWDVTEIGRRTTSPPASRTPVRRPSSFVERDELRIAAATALAAERVQFPVAASPGHEYRSATPAASHHPVHRILGLVRPCGRHTDGFGGCTMGAGLARAGFYIDGRVRPRLVCSRHHSTSISTPLDV